jgi:hypothetical protein
MKPCVLYFRGSWHLLLSLALDLICPGLRGELVIHLSFRGSMLFCIEKPHGLVTTLLSLEIGVSHPYGLV